MLKQPINLPIGKNKYRLEEGYSVSVLIDSKPCTLTVPKGFISDGNSVPRALSWFMRRDGLVRGPSVVHDYLYKNEGVVAVRWADGEFGTVSLEREECDGLYESLLERAGISGFVAASAYWGVRSCGWMHWGNK